MASPRDRFAGVRNTFVPKVPSQADLIELVRKNDLDGLTSAFDKHDLKTDNLLHRVRSPEMVDFLVGKGADVNKPYQNKDGPGDNGDPTPLFFAAFSANAETVQRLLHHGAGPDAGGVVDGYPLGCAVTRDDDQQEAVVRALLNAGAGTRGALGEAIKEKHATIGTITALLEHGADPNGCLNEYGGLVLVPALSLAAGQARGDVVDLLLDNGADPMERNVSQMTALHYARDPEMVDKLVARSADPAALLNAANERGDTALTYAATSGQIDMATKLLDLGADPALAMQGAGWLEEERNVLSGIYPRHGRNEAMHLVHAQVLEKEKQALRQTFAEVEQEQAHEVAEQPAPRRRVRL
jgi:ankyrin repeat protein